MFAASLCKNKSYLQQIDERLDSCQTGSHTFYSTSCRILCTPSILFSLILFPRLISHRPNIVYVASNHFVWRLVPVSISSQIRQLLQEKQFELALQLAVSFTLPLNLVTK